MFCTVIKTIISSIQEHFFDWLITAIITYFTVKASTKQYYYRTRKKIATGVMELGLRSMMNLQYSERLPDTAKAIFVEYGKSSLFMSKEKLKNCKCSKRRIANLRKTVASVGNSEMDISLFRPKEYGVLGLANKRRKALLFDFCKGHLFEFSNGKITQLNVQEETYFIFEHHKLAKINGNDRSVMIAVPILESYSGSRLLGGVTFDFAPGEKTVYKEILPEDDEKTKTEKTMANKKVFESAINTARYLRIAYFQKMEEDDK